MALSSATATLDHWGGLPGFLQKHRASMRSDLPLYVGGEDAFCRRVARGPSGAISPFGTLDRKELAAARLRLMVSETPQVIDGHAFTTGVVPRKSIERVLPNSQVIFGVADGAGCDPARYGDHHFTEAELSGQPQPDQHLHEHGTCFNVRGRGLVVITSCGHGGIINTIRRAKEVSGVDKVHALVGGFHLAPAPANYLAKNHGRAEEARYRSYLADALQRIELPGASQARGTASTGPLHDRQPVHLYGLIVLDSDASRKGPLVLACADEVIEQRLAISE